MEAGGRLITMPMSFVTRMRWKALLLGVLLIAVLSLLLCHLLVPPYIDRTLNRTTHSPPFDIASPRASELHSSLQIADLHADSLIWGRDLLQRNQRGQVDVPRLLKGNVSLQVFSVPTQVPRQRSESGTSPDQLNLITLSSIGQLWPPSTWWSLQSRALYLAGLLRRIAVRSQGRLVVVESPGDLRKHLEGPRPETGRMAGVLALEGLHCLEGDLDALDRLFAAGYRIMGLVHQFDNRLGGSSYGLEKGGLTPFGRQVVARIEQLGAIVDLAHASPKLFDDVLAATTRPLVVSHGGVKGTSDRRRNLGDEHLEAIGRRGGLIGIGFWSGAVCGTDAAAIARAVRHAVEVAGIEAVCLGSDFDGDRTPFDATGLVQITEALLEVGFQPPEIRQIMGGNLLRFLGRHLPSRNEPGDGS